MANVEAIDISSISNLCQALEKIVKNSFGPNALSTLLSSASGTIFITNDGMTLLQSIKFEAPINKIIFDSVSSHHQVTGDNAKSFIFILTDIIREMSRTFKTSDRATRIFGLRDGFSRLGIILHTVILKQLKNYVRFCKNGGILEACINLMRTTICRSFDQVTCRILTELGIKLLYESCQTPHELHLSALELIEDFGDLFVKVSGQPVSMSRIIPGVIIQRDFCVYFKDIFEKSVKFIILNCPIENTTPESTATMYLRQHSQIEKAFTYSTTSLEQKLNKIKERGVGLILTTENVSDTAKHLCSLFKISVIQFVSKEDVHRLSKFSRVLVNSCVDDFSLSLGEVKECERILVGSKICVNLVTSLGNASQVIICAPSIGLVTEYTRAIQNAIKLIRVLTEDVWDQNLEESSQSLSSQANEMFLVMLPGGGASEIIISNALRNYAAHHRQDHYISQAASLLAQAILSIPRMLHQNSFAGGKSNWIEILNEAMNNVNAKSSKISVDGKSGNLVDGFQVGLFDSLNSKIKLYTDVLNLLQLILKIDAIVL